MSNGVNHANGDGVSSANNLVTGALEAQGTEGFTHVLLLTNIGLDLGDFQLCVAGLNTLGHYYAPAFSDLVLRR